MPKPRRSREAAVGTVFALALVVLALAIMAIGGERQLFTDKTRYFIVFPHADGLDKGSPVKMNGVQVGTVSSIRLPTNPSDTGIRVDIAVDEDYSARVREDSGARLRILLLLSGEKFVEIEPGSLSRPPLPAGSQIALVRETELLEQGQVIAEDLTEITTSLKDILGELQHGEGLIAKMIRDPEFGKPGLEALHATLQNLESISGELRAGHGVAGRLLSDDALGARLDHLAAAAEQLASLVAAVQRGEGALGALVIEGGPADAAVERLAEAAASLERTAAQLESQQNLIGRLLHDQEYSEALAAHLESAVKNLAEATEKLNSDQGTLGALLADRTLYDSAEEVVAGVNDSKFARWLLRHYRKKGIKAQSEEAPPPAAEEPPAP